MRVGSLVECVCLGFDTSRCRDKSQPNKGDVDIVIDVTDRYGRLFLVLDRFPDCGFSSNSFREIQFPPSLEVEIKEMLTLEPVLI